MLDLNTARDLVAKAIEKTNADFKRPICVSIVDHYGFLVAFARMDGAPIRSIEISRRKAFTSVRMGVSTEAFLARIRKDNIDASWFGDDMLPLPGGCLLKDKSAAVIGAIGISGLAASEDHVIAEAVAALVG